MTNDSSGSRSFAGGSLSARAEVDQRDDALVLAEAEQLADGRLAERAGRAPVRGEAARRWRRAGSRRPRRRSRAGLPRRSCGSPESFAVASTSVGARRSFVGLLLARGVVDQRPRLGAEDAEAPRLRQLVIRREPGQIEQLREVSRRRPARRRSACGCGGCGWRSRRSRALTVPVWNNAATCSRSSSNSRTTRCASRSRSPGHDVHHAVEHAAGDLAQSVRIPGFRKGKVPMPLLVQRVGRERLYSEAVESHIGRWFWSAATRARVNPVALPEYEYELPTSDHDNWQFVATVDVQPKPEPADWTELEVPRDEARGAGAGRAGRARGAPAFGRRARPRRGPPGRRRRHRRRRPRRPRRLGPARLRRRARLRPARRGDRERHPRPRRRREPRDLVRAGRRLRTAR